MDILEQLNALQPIEESAVELRIDPGISWPEELADTKDFWAQGPLHAFNEARDAFARYRATRSLNEKNIHLSAAGKLAADKEAAEELIPALTKRLERLREQAANIDKNVQSMTEEALAAPLDEGDGPRPSEVRAWLLTIPECERSDRAQALIRQGDKMVLRAVLTAPSWMTGVPPEVLADLRDDVVKQSDPDRYRRIQAVKKGIVAAERALQGVQRFLAQDTGPGAVHHRATTPNGVRRAG